MDLLRARRWRAVMLLAPIGAIAGSAQTALAQGAKAPAALELGDREAEQIRDRFTTIMLKPLVEDPRPGWQLAARLGAPVGPVLWEMLRRASALSDRLRLLAAYAQAMGTAGDEQLADYAAGSEGPRERAFALLLIALGDPREGPPPPRLGLAVDASDPEVLRVSALLALSCYGDAAPAEPSAGWRDDPGLLAASLYAGAEPPADLERIAPWRADSAAAELVWRGYLLSPRPGDGGREERLGRARDLYAHRSDRLMSARSAAALSLARSPQREAVGDFLATQDVEVELGLVLGLDPGLRRTLVSVQRSRPWFVSTAPLLPTAEQRGRSAVIFVLHETLARVEAVAPEWNALRGRAPVVLRAIALGLAWRFLADGRRDGAWSRPPAAFEGMPERAWVAWALGDEPGPDAFVAFDDAGLTRAFELAIAGRLPVEAARRELELALWRSGVHPMLTLRELHRGLVRDLLLRGCSLFDGPYLPRGIDRSDGAYFRTADDYYRFTEEPRRPPPPQWQLERVLDRG